MNFGDLPECVFCGQTLDPRIPGTYKRVEGWVENRGGTGGANAVAFRRDLGEFAHRFCVEQRKMSISADQQAMF
jgi:hypothetical protein